MKCTPADYFWMRCRLAGLTQEEIEKMSPDEMTQWNEAITQFQQEQALLYKETLRGLLEEMRGEE